MATEIYFAEITSFEDDLNEIKPKSLITRVSPTSYKSLNINLLYPMEKRERVFTSLESFKTKKQKQTEKEKIPIVEVKEEDVHEKSILAEKTDFDIYSWNIPDTVKNNGSLDLGKDHLNITITESEDEVNNEVNTDDWSTVSSKKIKKHQEPLPAYVKPRSQNIKTRICQSILNGTSCRFGSNCKFAHDYENYYPATCSYGNKCRYLNCNNYNNNSKMCQFFHPALESKSSFLYRLYKIKL